MGQTLSEPVTTKETASCGNSFYKVASSSMQGWRINMEDAHAHLLAIPGDSDASFFAVFDGHGGPKVSQYAELHLHTLIASDPAYLDGRIEEAMKNGFLNLDEKMKSDEEMQNEMSGTTAVVAIIKNGKIYCGNVGDSRAVACVAGVAVPLSFDHKPSNEIESQRIIAAGGWIEVNRVNGNLALSRALGDFVFKRNDSKSAEEQIVTACPDIIVSDLTSDHEFIVLACDGIWDVMTNQAVTDFCRERLAAGIEPDQICEELLSRCLSPDSRMGGLGCDNMTVVLVCLLQNQSFVELAAKCSRNSLENVDINAVSDMSDVFSTPEPSPIKFESRQDDDAEERSMHVFISNENTSIVGEPPSEFTVVTDLSRKSQKSDVNFVPENLVENSVEN